jgi:hypothetical protein
MGYFSERSIAIRNAIERGLSPGEVDFDLDDAVARLGGEVDGKFIRCPSPGRPPDDRSLFVKFNQGEPYIYECDGNLGRAYAFVRSQLGLSERVRRDYSETISRILHETRVAPGTLVARYLSTRALTIAPPTALKFHELLKHSPTGRWFPVMVAERTDVDGTLAAIHRTYLEHDGSGKAHIEPPRMDLGPAQGTAIRLAPVSEELMIGEGIETTLSVMQETGKPGWAAGSAAMMRLLKLPKEVRRVTILADGDHPGEKAARAAATRWMSEGRTVAIARPPWGFDFNDMLMGRV